MPLSEKMPIEDSDDLRTVEVLHQVNCVHSCGVGKLPWYCDAASCALSHDRAFVYVLRDGVRSEAELYQHLASMFAQPWRG